MLKGQSNNMFLTRDYMHGSGAQDEYKVIENGHEIKDQNA